VDARALLDLLLLTDSGLPTGAFTGSNGWEAAARRGWLTGADDVTAWLRGLVEDQLACLELPAVARATRGKGPWDADRLLDRFAVVEAQRRESRRAGARLLELAGYPSRPCHRAAASGWLAGLAGVDAEAACAAYAHVICLGQTQAAVRLGVCTADEAVSGLRELHPVIAAAAATAASGRIRPYLAARAELAGLAHASLSARLFSS
jgi:urease accessory protein UreF